jgi:hypothetical protein
MNSPDFAQSVKQWIEYDARISRMQDEIKVLRAQKHAASTIVCNHLISQNKPYAKISAGNMGAVKMHQKVEYSTLTFSYIRKCLGELIEDADQVNTIVDYLHDNREITTTNELRLSNVSARTRTRRSMPAEIGSH